MQLTTVKTHLSRVLMKLGLCDRAQVVVAAYESGLVTPGQDPAGPGHDHTNHPGPNQP